MLTRAHFLKQFQLFVLGENNPPTATGKISGYVYEDANSNWIKDTTEKNLSWWKIHIQKTGVILPNSCKQTEREEDDDEEWQKQNNKCYRYTIVSNNLWYYELPNLYSWTYTIQEMVKENWSITSPTKTTTNPSQTYTLTLTNWQQVTGKNFGNKKLKKN